jgi:hypothetical protein
MTALRRRGGRRHGSLSPSAAAAVQEIEGGPHT